jgi:hypothetical protein
VATAAGSTAVPFKRSTGSISQPATISSIQEEDPRDRSAGWETEGRTSIMIHLQAMALPRPRFWDKRWGIFRIRKRSKLNEHTNKCTTSVTDPLEYIG